MSGVHFKYRYCSGINFLVVIGIAANQDTKIKLLMPILIAGILFYATIGYKLLPECDPKEEEAFDTKRDFDQVPKWKQWMSLIILILTLLAMIFEEKIGISLCVSGGIGAFAFDIDRCDFRKRCIEIY